MQKGYGFIIGEDSMDYFVHFTALPEKVILKEKDNVTFDVEKGDKGNKAINIVIE